MAIPVQFMFFLGLTDLFWLSLWLLSISSSFCLQVDIDPLKMIANSKRIDSLQIFMRGLLQLGDHYNLVKLLKCPVYDLEQIYVQFVCPRLEVRQFQKIIDNRKFSTEEKGILLPADCLSSGTILSSLDRSFASLLPVNPLLSQYSDLNKIKPGLWLDLLRRSLTERTPLDSAKVFAYFSEKLQNEEVLPAHSLLLLTKKTFCAQCQNMKILLSHSGLINMFQLTPESSQADLIECLHRLMSLASIQRYLTACPEGELEENIKSISTRLLEHFEEMRLPRDQDSRIIMALINSILLSRIIEISEYLSVAEHAQFPLQPEWIVENLELFEGGMVDFSQFLSRHVLRFRAMNSPAVEKAKRFLKQRFNSISFGEAPVPQTSLQEKLRKTRANCLPDSSYQCSFKLPTESNPYSNLSKIWMFFKANEFYHSNAFQFFSFGHDKRQVFDLILKEFLSVQQLYFNTESGKLFPSPFCPPSLLNSVAALLHQNALLRANPTFVIDEQYFRAALEDNEQELVALFSATIPIILPFYSNFISLVDLPNFESTNHLLHLFNAGMSSPKRFDNIFDFTVLKHNFLNGASGFAATLREVFSEQDYSIDEIYTVLFANKKRIN